MYPVFLSWPWSVWIQPNHRKSYGLVKWILFIVVALIGVNAARPYEFKWIGDMYPVHYCGFILCEWFQTIGVHVFRWHVSCLLLLPFLVWMQPSHRNSFGLVTCILFSIVVLFWWECSQNIRIHMVARHVYCLLLRPYLVWMQPNHGNSYGLVICILFIIVAFFGMNAAKP